MGPIVTKAKQVVRPFVRGSPVAEAAELGADRLADLFHRIVDEDLVAIDIPATTAHRAGRVRMRRHGGRDQIARDVGQGGVWGFEPPLPALFIELARRSTGDVFDVGANTGLYSILAVAANRTTRVHAVEPLPNAAELLDANLALNRRLARRVQVHRCALSDTSGTAPLYLPPPSGATIETSASLDPTFKDEVASAVDVETRSLDDLWEEVGRPDVGLVKIDTEGTEHLVIRGAHKALESNRPVVICEVLPRARTDELTAFLARTQSFDVRLQRDRLILGEVVTFDPDAWNHAFVPQEMLPTFRAAALAVGLNVADGRAV